MKSKLLALLTILLLIAASAQAEQARDITAECTISPKNAARDTAAMLDRNYKTTYTLRSGGAVQFAAGEEISGFFLQMYDEEPTLEICVQQHGEWTPHSVTQPYMSGWYALPEGATGFSLHNPTAEKAYIAEITICGAGERPVWAAQWHAQEKCDLMLITAHPDDEVLWFGGTLPTYAGERGLAVQAVCLVPTTPRRRLELLDALWTCGVTAYPEFAYMRDEYETTLKKQYAVWSRDTLYNKIVWLLRTHKPDVVVTHDFQGEYGHGAHMACADAVAYAVRVAADPAKHPHPAGALEPWQPRKLYIHLWEENEIHLDWQQPLAAFGGRTGLDIASEALACHVSQVRHGWTMEKSIAYDNTRFGLYFTTVGDDVLGGDFMENIPAAGT